MNHATLTAYGKGCRCEACVAHKRRHQKQYSLDKVRGVSRLADAKQLHDHVAMLTAAGMSEWDIVIAAGWKSRNSLAECLRRDKVLPRTLARVLAVKPVSDRRNRYVDATGSRRRLQALAVMGWPYRVMAERIGELCPESVALVMSGSTRTVRAGTASLIARAYDEMWATPGPSARSASLARRKGWVPPLGWDDETLDDPAARPHGVDWGARKRDRAAVVEDFAEMRADGLTFAHIAERLGMTEVALERALHRARKDGLDVPDFGRAA